MFKIWNWFLSLFGYKNSYYANHNEAVIIACFYNPEKNEYRSKAFKKWYKTIQGLNYKIVELLIGPDAIRETPSDDINITVIRSDSYLWHKESLLNYVIKNLPTKFKYVFWIDTDLIFTNKNWLIDSVSLFKTDDVNILQPFEFGIHLEKDEITPSFNIHVAKINANKPDYKIPKTKRLWRSFCATYVNNYPKRSSDNYDRHGHVGFAWGMKRELLDEMPLYDKALIGGADHIIAHASVGEIPHKCISRAYIDNIDEVEKWSEDFHSLIKCKIGYVDGDIYHLWHGDLVDRRYFQRVVEFTKTAKDITTRDSNGLFVAKNGQDEYVRRYYQHRDNEALDPMNDAVNILTNLYASGIIQHHDNDRYGNNNSSSIFNDTPVGLPNQSDIDVSPNNDVQPIHESMQAEITDETFTDLDTTTFS